MKALMVLQKDVGGEYEVEFPEYPKCFSAGVNRDDAVRNGIEALDLYLENGGEVIEFPSYFLRSEELSDSMELLFVGIERNV